MKEGGRKVREKGVGEKKNVGGRWAANEARKKMRELTTKDFASRFRAEEGIKVHFSLSRRAERIG